MKYPQIVSMPSAVSNWLEEQLEARGIDAVVYTRYILSLLHTDAVDVINSDEDLQFSHSKKEVRRPGGNRKRIRHSSEWWRLDEAEAERIKRSAAVECLMSASEQTCGIESLIDELWQKLEDIKSDVHTPSQPPLSKKPELQQVSPQESAKRYYAAFPALTRSSPSKLLSLVPKWIPSPKKKNIAITNSTSRKYNSRSASLEDKLRSHMEADNMKSKAGGKQRVGCYLGRYRKEFGRAVARPTESMDHWDLSMFGNSKSSNATTRTNNNKTTTDWPQHDEILKIETTLESDQCVDNNREWNIEEETNMYEYLPVGIRELLDDSPVPQDDNVEMMNIANVRNTEKKVFIPYRTNFTSSIWSFEAAEKGAAFQDTFNGDIDLNDPEAMLDLKFSSITINNNNNKREWHAVDDSSLLRNNERSRFFEGPTSESFLNDSWNYAPSKEKWSDDSGCFDDDIVGHLTSSFLKLNHSKGSSAFVEIAPRAKSQTFSPFAGHSNVVDPLLRDTFFKTIDLDGEKDDLLTSLNSHFRPINDKIENCHQGQYADGSTFTISNNLDKIIYRRTESGAMYLESDYAMRKKYCEYKPSTGGIRLSDIEFVLKFIVCQNDKASQTEDDDKVVVPAVAGTAGNDGAPTEENCKSEPAASCKRCTCQSNRTKAMDMDFSINDELLNTYCPLHQPSRSDSATLAEMTSIQMESKPCDKCNNNSSVWNTDCLKSVYYEPEWDDQSLRGIWSGGEICHTCLGRPPSTLQHSKLREDVSQLGDQLLSDLNSTIQKSCMEDLSMMEFNCDISEMLPKERKRRHSYVAAHSEDSGTWSFTSRLEEDCLIQMSTIPTLRSVTL